MMSLIATLVTIAFVPVPIVIVWKVARRLQQVRREFSDPARLQRMVAETATILPQFAQRVRHHAGRRLQEQGVQVHTASAVRAVDQEWQVEWRAGIPDLSLAASAFRGQKVEMSFGTAYAFREEDLRYGKVYDYRFNTKELKAPPIEAAQQAGWGWKGVAFGKL